MKIYLMQIHRNKPRAGQVEDFVNIYTSEQSLRAGYCEYVTDEALTIKGLFEVDLSYSGSIHQLQVVTQDYKLQFVATPRGE